jgi:hypothetical protein
VSLLAAAVVLGQLVAPAPAAPAAPAATAAPAAPAARVLSFSDRSEVRFRSRLQGGQAADLETTLGSTLALGEPHDTLRLFYGPRLSYLDIEGDRTLALMHVGRAEGAWWTRQLRFTLTLDGSIGSQSAIGFAAPVLPGGDAVAPTTGAPAASLPPATVPAAPAIPIYFPQVLVLQLGSFRGSAGALYTFSRRWSGGANAYFAMAGGLDYDSQLFFEPYRNPGGELTATYSADRRDQLVSRIRSSYTWTLISKGDFLTVDATESIRHAWSIRTQSILGAGMALLRSEEKAGDGHTGAIVGVGEASIIHTRPLDDGGAIAFRAAALLGTAYNPVLALVQPQLSGTLSSVWTRGKVSVTVSADALMSLPVDSPIASRVASGSLLAGYTPADPVQLQAGVRAYVEVFPTTAGTSYPPQWVTFVAVMLRSPLIDL